MTRICHAASIAFALAQLACGSGGNSPITIVSPAEGEFVSGTVDIVLEVDGDLGDITVEVAGAGIGVAQGPDYTIAYDSTTAIADGPVNIVASGGGESTTASVKVDNRAPILMLQEPRAAYYEDDTENFAVRTLATDGNLIPKIGYEILGDVATVRETLIDANGEFDAPFAWGVTADAATGMSDRNINLRVRAVDGFGRLTEVADSFTLSSRHTWTQDMAALSYGHPMVDSDGFLWLGMTKTMPFQATLFKLDPNTGSTLCSLVLPAGERIWSATQAADLIVFGTSMRARAVRRSDCVEPWTSDAPAGNYRPRPVYDAANDRVFMTTEAGGNITAITASTGLQTGLAIAVGQDITSAPVVAGSQLFVATTAGFVHGYDLATAMPLSWSPRELGGAVEGDTVLDGSVLYAAAADGFLYGVDITDGTSSFQANVNEGVLLAAPVLAPDGTILVTTTMSNLHAYSPSEPGAPVWSANIGFVLSKSTPTIVGNAQDWVVYVPSTAPPTDGVIHVISGASSDGTAPGTTLWRADVAGQIEVSGALSADRIFVTTSNQQALAFEIGAAVHLDL